MRLEYIKILRDFAEQSNDTMHSLPGLLYTSPEIFNHDLDIIKSGWIPLLHTSQIPTPSSILPIDILGYPLLVTYDEQKTFHVFMRLCRHRGADLLENGKDIKSTKTIVCPYHSWSYKLDGTLHTAPHMDQNKSFCKNDNGLIQIKSTIKHGIVFVNFSGDAPPFDELYPESVHEINKYNIENLTIAYEDKWQIKTNWKLFSENFLESYHHIGTHSKSLNQILPASAGHIKDNYTDSVWLCTPISELEIQKINSLEDGQGINFPLVNKKFSAAEKKAIYGVYLPPLLFLVLQPDRVIWYQVFPTDVDKTLIITKTFISASSAENIDFKNQLLDEQNDFNIIHAEDIDSLERTFRGLLSMPNLVGALSHLELGYKYFYKQLLRIEAAKRSN